MSSILSLASDYLDRMSNPAFGLLVNEEYSLRFSKLLQEENFEEKIITEASDIQDIDALTLCGWLWLLKWGGSKGFQINARILLDLAVTSSSVFVQSAVIDYVTVRASEEYNARARSLNDWAGTWLYQLIERSIVSDDTRAQSLSRRDESLVNTRLAEKTLTALLQVNIDITITAARLFLRHRWAGQKTLNRYFFSLYDQLDPETKAIWKERVRPPQDL